MHLDTQPRSVYQPLDEVQTPPLPYQTPETESHTRRVTELTMHLAHMLNVAEPELKFIYLGSLLHDIGMTNIPERIQLKPELLTEEEWKLVRRHPEYAYRMLEKVGPQDLAVMDIPYSHHEKWDGSGYPRGLEGEAIPLAARLFAIADVWDSLTSDRPYRAAWTWSEAMDYIDEQAGRHFDPALVNVFLRGSPNPGI